MANPNPKISKIECLQLRSPHASPDDCDGAVDTAVIRITADNGVYGLGETDAPPNAIAALLETPTAHIWSRSVRDVLLGENPLEVEQLWDKLYEGTIYHGRRGLGIMLISAIDIPASIQTSGLEPALRRRLSEGPLDR